MFWSAQDKDQAIGRVFRPPQLKKVIIYQLILSGTSDVFLDSVAENKGIMHQALMNMPLELRKSLIPQTCLTVTNSNTDRECTRGRGHRLGGHRHRRI